MKITRTIAVQQVKVPSDHQKTAKTKLSEQDIPSAEDVSRMSWIFKVKGERMLRVWRRPLNGQQAVCAL